MKSIVSIVPCVRRRSNRLGYKLEYEVVFNNIVAARYSTRFFARRAAKHLLKDIEEFNN